MLRKFSSESRSRDGKGKSTDMEKQVCLPELREKSLEGRAD